jgi:alkylation response protein AidB-like acyl-CoA dehydrogenase
VVEAVRRLLYTDEHQTFRAAFRRFLDAEAVPNIEAWETAGVTPKQFWRDAGKLGFLGFEAPVEHGGLGVADFRYNAVIQEEVAATAIATDGGPFGRVCRPEDVADAVAYLVGPSASYVTGHRLVIDGGGPATSLLPGVG